jgi:aminoglycoside phosphotransferase family enzyme/predicted kinase
MPGGGRGQKIGGPVARSVDDSAGRQEGGSLAMAMSSQAVKSTGPAATVDETRAAMSNPGFYPGRPERVEVRETHISWVFLAGERAYKLKKPLVLPFLDYGTPARRREMCHEEVRLNRRLAGDLYLGVRAVAARDGGLALADEDDPHAIDYLVEMRLYDERRSLAGKLARGELKQGEVADVARLLARFHSHAPHAATAGVPAVALERRLTENFHELLAVVEQHAEIERVLALERFAHAFVVACASMFDARVRHGLVREVHGDLRAEHVLLDGRLQIVDCIEFNPELRNLDVADDLAFLVMDLTAHGGERFAQTLLRAYRDAGGDSGEDRLLAFYAAYRALVRAKVELLRAAQQPAAGAAHGRHSSSARDLLALAERFCWQARLPLVIVICGLPATGKSHLARALAAMSQLAHLNSDVVRKRLAGMLPTQRAPTGAYTADFNRLTYGELGRLAAREVTAHGGALVDATFRHRTDRDAFAKAFAGVAPLLFVECQAPADTLARRAAEREHRPASVSDASLQVVVRESSTWEPLQEVQPEAHVVLRGDRPVQAQLADVMALLDQRMVPCGTGYSGASTDAHGGVWADGEGMDAG